MPIWGGDKRYGGIDSEDTRYEGIGEKSSSQSDKSIGISFDSKGDLLKPTGISFNGQGVLSGSTGISFDTKGDLSALLGFSFSTGEITSSESMGFSFDSLGIASIGIIRLHDCKSRIEAKISCQQIRKHKK